MQLKCIKCNERLYPSIDDVKAVSEMIIRHGLDATAFLDALAPIGGKCKDGERHIYEFDKSFKDEIYNLSENFVRLQKYLVSERDACNKLLEERKELEAKLIEVIENIEKQIEKIKQIDNDIKSAHDECERLTGTCNIQLWI
jgi:chromosome segregation ATPase